MSIARRRSSTEISRRQSIASQDYGSLRTSELTIIDDNESPQYPIPVHLASGCGRGQEKFVIRRGKAATALETIEIAFNGHEGHTVHGDAVHLGVSNDGNHVRLQGPYIHNF